MENYTYAYIYEYIPTTSNATDAQVRQRNEVLDFMDGCPSRALREEIASRIRSLARGQEGRYILAFLPSWSRERTVQRYGSLARHLAADTHIETYLDALSLKQDGDPVLKIKELTCNQERICGRNIIVIGSIYTTGRTFRKACDILLKEGAGTVDGIFIAKVKDTAEVTDSQL